MSPVLADTSPRGDYTQAEFVLSWSRNFNSLKAERPRARPRVIDRDLEATGGNIPQFLRDDL